MTGIGELAVRIFGERVFQIGISFCKCFKEGMYLACLMNNMEVIVARMKLQGCRG